MSSQVTAAPRTYQAIRDLLIQLYLEDERPWLVGFSGGKDSTMLASLIFDAVLRIPDVQRKKPVSILCTDTRVEIPAIADMVEGTLARMQKFSRQKDLKIEANLLKRLLALQEETDLTLITPEELLLIQQMWKAARDPDDGRGVARILNQHRGIIMNANLSELNRLREMEDEVAQELGVRAETLRRMLAKVEEYSESHRAHGLPDDLLNILKDDLHVSTVRENASPAY
jgi:hypothetical protein